MDELEEERSSKLTTRQHQLLNMLKLGLCNKQIAQELGLKENTVEKYLSFLYTKLGVQSRVQAVIWHERMLKRERHRHEAALEQE